MATVDASSAVIGGTFNLATPTVSLDCGPTKDIVAVHLDHGLNKPDLEKNAAALRIDGQVTVTGAPGSFPADFEVAFLQFVRFNFLGIFYAGRKNSEGSIGILIHSALSDKALLDPNPPLNPWVSESHFTKTGNLAKNSMGDHPFFQTARQISNGNTGVPNFLFQIVDDRDFWTVFSVREAGKFQHLMHIHWHVRHDQQFNWRSGVPVPTKAASSFTPDKTPTPGPPTDPDLKTLLSVPAASDAKAALKKAIKKAIVPPSSNRSDNPTRFFGVPQDFFR
jgi:hypothetical protein